MDETEWRRKSIWRYVWLSFSGPLAGCFALLLAFVLQDIATPDFLNPVLAIIVLCSPLIGFCGAIMVYLERNRPPEAAVIATLGLLSNVVVICLLALPFYIGFD